MLPLKSKLNQMYAKTLISKWLCNCSGESKHKNLIQKITSSVEQTE